MSKSFGLAGLRIGWLATRDAELREQLAGFKHYLTICSAGPSELLAIIALRARDAVLARSRAIVEANLPVLDDFIARRRDFSWVRPRAGTTGLIQLDGDVPVDVFARARGRRGGRDDPLLRDGHGDPLALAAIRAAEDRPLYLWRRARSDPPGAPALDEQHGLESEVGSSEQRELEQGADPVGVGRTRRRCGWPRPRRTAQRPARPRGRADRPRRAPRRRPAPRPCPRRPRRAPAPRPGRRRGPAPGSAGRSGASSRSLPREAFVGRASASTMTLAGSSTSPKGNDGSGEPKSSRVRIKQTPCSRSSIEGGADHAGTISTAARRTSGRSNDARTRVLGRTVRGNGLPAWVSDGESPKAAPASSSTSRGAPPTIAFLSTSQPSRRRTVTRVVPGGIPSGAGTLRALGAAPATSSSGVQRTRVQASSSRRQDLDGRRPEAERRVDAEREEADAASLGRGRVVEDVIEQPRERGLRGAGAPSKVSVTSSAS